MRRTTRLSTLAAWLGAAALAVAGAACGDDDDDVTPTPDAPIVADIDAAAGIDAPPGIDAGNPDAGPAATHGGSLALFELSVTIPTVGTLKSGAASVGFERLSAPYLAPDAFESTSAINPAAGCAAYYFDFAEGDLPTTNTGDAGDVTFTGATGGDVTCTRVDRGGPFAGLFTYDCGAFPPGAGDFIAADDAIDLDIAGGADFGAAQKAGVTAPAVPIAVETNLSGLDLSAVGPWTIDYHCGPNDGTNCAGNVIVVSIQTTDTALANPLTNPTEMPTPTNEFATILCSYLVLEGHGQSVEIPASITAALNDVSAVTTNYRAVVFQGMLNGATDEIGSAANFVVGEGQTGFCKLTGGCNPGT